MGHCGEVCPLDIGYHIVKPCGIELGVWVFISFRCYLECLLSYAATWGKPRSLGMQSETEALRGLGPWHGSVGSVWPTFLIVSICADLFAGARKCGLDHNLEISSPHRWRLDFLTIYYPADRDRTQILYLYGNRLSPKECLFHWPGPRSVNNSSTL